jgi:hypothetical protein
MNHTIRSAQNLKASLADPYFENREAKTAFYWSTLFTSTSSVVESRAINSTPVSPPPVQ